MSTISLKKGLNLPFKNEADFTICKKWTPKIVSIDLSPFMYLHLKLLKKEGETIHKGEVIAKDLHQDDRVFLSPYSGKIVDTIRGKRRRLQTIVVELAKSDKEESIKPLSLEGKKEELIENLIRQGFSFYIHRRPFHRVIGKEDLPRSIFIHTITSAPYTPSFAFLVQENKELFQKGIDLLQKFAPIHLIYNEELFTTFSGTNNHKAEGLHPIESPSIHIAALDPIQGKEDVIWSLDVFDILNIGSLLQFGYPFSDTIIALAGDGFEKEERTLIKTKQGICIEEITNKKEHTLAGDPLTGSSSIAYLKAKDRVITAFTPKEKGEILPFLKGGWSKATQTKTYLAGLLRRKNLAPAFIIGGEERPFIVKDIYQNYFPMHIYIEPLIKALLAKDYDLAIALGFLEIDTKDLAICEYMCPSKIPLMSLFEEAKEGYLVN